MVVRTGLNTCMGSMVRQLIAPTRLQLEAAPFVEVTAPLTLERNWLCCCCIMVLAGCSYTVAVDDVDKLIVDSKNLVSVLLAIMASATFSFLPHSAMMLFGLDIRLITLNGVCRHSNMSSLSHSSVLTPYA